MVKRKVDREGNLTRIVGPEGERTDISYDGADRREIVRAFHATPSEPPDPEEYIETSYTYDGADNLTTILRPDGEAVTLAYDLDNRLTDVSDTSGTIAGFTYDENGNVETRSTGLSNQTWTFEYDLADRLTVVKDPVVESPDKYTQYDYDANGNRTDLVDNNGVHTKYGYDGLNRLTSMIENFEGTDDTADTTTTYGYNGVRQVSISDHDDNTTTYVYDDALRLTKATYPDSAGGSDVVTYTYDPDGSLETRTDQRGVVTEYAYDHLHQLTDREYSGPLGTRAETFAFDRSGRLTAADNGVVDTTLTYDLLGRMTSSTMDFGGGSAGVYSTGIEYVVAEDDLRQVVTYPSGREVTDTLDRRSRLESVASDLSSPGAPAGVTWGYDDGDRRESAALANGAQSLFDYDLNNRLLRLRHARDFSPSLIDPMHDIEYRYDAVGNRLLKRDNLRTDRSELYGYDQRHRLRSMLRGELDGDIDVPAEVTIPSPINDGEMVQSQAWPMGDSQASPPVEPGLDRRGNWAGFEYETGTAVASQSRTANAANEYESVYTTIGGLIVGQLLEHDAAGNLVEIALVGDLNCDGEVNINDIGAFSLAISDPPAYAAAYPDCNIDLGDINGDTYVNIGDINAFTALLSAGHPAAARRYTYDEENRLTAVTEWDETPLLEIEYDALGRRVLTKDHVGGCGTGFQPVKTRHIYAGIETLEEHVCCGEAYPDCESEDWALAREFLWGERFPEPLAMIDYTDAGDVPAAGTTGGGAETLHFVHDALGSVIGLLDAGDPDATPTPIPPKMVERYEYDPYGRTYVEAWDAGTSEWVRLTPQGDASAASSRFGNPFAWTGQRYDAAVGMYHFLFRSYLPELGRWMQRDPLTYVSGINLNEYISSRPAVWIDPLGLDRWHRGVLHTGLDVGPINGIYYAIDFTGLGNYNLGQLVLVTLFGWNVGVPGQVIIIPTQRPGRPPDIRSDPTIDQALINMLSNEWFWYNVFFRNCDNFAKYFLDCGLVEWKPIPPEYFPKPPSPPAPPSEPPPQPPPVPSDPGTPLGGKGPPCQDGKGPYGGPM
ncbi:tRNA nuclease WapA precursor [Phycisphaerae bacterium RAS1]|nr:tRNA nuclease WapA precursor [Phycisphaerae bacterium RAS1]